MEWCRSEYKRADRVGGPGRDGAGEASEQASCRWFARPCRSTSTLGTRTDMAVSALCALNPDPRSDQPRSPDPAPAFHSHLVPSTLLLPSLSPRTNLPPFANTRHALSLDSATPVDAVGASPSGRVSPPLLSLLLLLLPISPRECTLARSLARSLPRHVQRTQEPLPAHARAAATSRRLPEVLRGSRRARTVHQPEGGLPRMPPPHQGGASLLSPALAPREARRLTLPLTLYPPPPRLRCTADPSLLRTRHTRSREHCGSSPSTSPRRRASSRPSARRQRCTPRAGSSAWACSTRSTPRARAQRRRRRVARAWDEQTGLSVCVCVCVWAVPGRVLGEGTWRELSADRGTGNFARPTRA